MAKSSSLPCLVAQLKGRAAELDAMEREAQEGLERQAKLANEEASKLIREAEEVWHQRAAECPAPPPPPPPFPVWQRWVYSAHRP